MKTADGIFSLLTSIVVLATITTLILPNRQTSSVIKSGGNVFVNALKTAQGR